RRSVRRLAIGISKPKAPLIAQRARRKRAWARPSARRAKRSKTSARRSKSKTTRRFDAATSWPEYNPASESRLRPDRDPHRPRGRGPGGHAALQVRAIHDPYGGDDEGAAATGRCPARRRRG